MEQTKHRTSTVVAAVLLCLPLLLIAWYSIQLMTGIAEFNGVSQVKLRLPNGEERVLTDEADVTFYTDILSRATALERPVRETAGETPLSLTVNDSVYLLYPSLELSGCMAQAPDGRLRLLTSDDAARLVARGELEYLYDAYRLPTLTVRSGDAAYAAQPSTYSWKYRRSDGVYCDDESTPVADGVPVFNIFANLESELDFSVQPSRYSMSVCAVVDGVDSYELPVTSLAGLHFTQDTLVSVEVTARWSQAANASRYGEATYRFRVLYDVPANVELIGAQEDGSIGVQAGDMLLLRALNTNEDEALSISATFETAEASFHYDADTHCSYAALPVGSENEAGAYSLRVICGSRVTDFSVQIAEAGKQDLISLSVSDEMYPTVNPAARAELESKLAALRAASDNRLRLQTDFRFDPPLEGTPAYRYGTSVLLANQSAQDDAGLLVLQADIYHAASGARVLATQDGICVFAGELGAAGNAVVIDHGCGIFSYYYHLDSCAVAVGDTVKRGGDLGAVGTSGYAGKQTTPVLQFGISVGDTYVRRPLR